MKLNKNDELSSFYAEISVLEDEIKDKERIISVQARDMQSLKREIISLKTELNYSKNRKK